jgi:hypothetical protein
VIAVAWSRRGVLLAALPLAPNSGHHEVQIAVSRADGAAWQNFKVDGGGDYDFPVWFGAGERTATFEAAPRRVTLGKNNQSFGWAPNTWVWRMDNFPITWGGQGGNQNTTEHLVTLHLYRLNEDPRLFDAVLDQQVQERREAPFLGENGTLPCLCSCACLAMNYVNLFIYGCAGTQVVKRLLMLNRFISWWHATMKIIDLPFDRIKTILTRTSSSRFCHSRPNPSRTIHLRQMPARE